MVANIPMENPDPFSSTLVALGSSRMALHCAFAAAAACAASEWDATRFRTASQLRWGLGAEVSISSLFCIIYIYIFCIYSVYSLYIYILCIYIYTHVCLIPARLLRNLGPNSFLDVYIHMFISRKHVKNMNAMDLPDQDDDGNQTKGLSSQNSRCENIGRPTTRCPQDAWPPLEAHPERLHRSMVIFTLWLFVT